MDERMQPRSPAMYKHILVATDGSKLSNKAIKTAARLARSLGARLTGVYVNPESLAPMYSEGIGLRAADVAQAVPGSSTKARRARRFRCSRSRRRPQASNAAP